MKNFLFLIVLSFSTLSFSQIAGEDARISFGLYQDGRLLFLGDNNGNDPFTLNGRFEFMMESDLKRGQIGSFLLGGTVEYADLSEFDFLRYGVQGGYNFRNNYMKLPLIGEFYYDNALYVGIGNILRGLPDSNSYISLELTNETQVFLTKWLSLNLKLTFMQRGDLEARYGDDKGSFRPWDWAFNGYGGVKIYL
jgi:hypothetical protein